jgi:hypothetical protein
VRERIQQRMDPVNQLHWNSAWQGVRAKSLLSTPRSIDLLRTNLLLHLRNLLLLKRRSQNPWSRKVLVKVRVREMFSRFVQRRIVVLADCPRIVSFCRYRLSILYFLIQNFICTIFKMRAHLRLNFRMPAVLDDLLGHVLYIDGEIQHV